MSLIVQVLSPSLGLKKVSNNKTKRVKLTHYDPLYLLSTHKTSGQQEGEHGRVQHVQGEHLSKKCLRIFVIVSGPVGNLKLSSVHSPKSINQSPKFQIHGLVQVNSSLVLFL